MQWHNVDGTLARRRGYNGASIWDAMVQCRGVAMARCSRSAQQCLTSAAGFDFARFAAAWVWGSCQTVFVWFSVFNVFLLIHVSGIFHHDIYVH